MLRMDGFRYLHATDPAQAVDLFLGHEDAAYLAGGTDLLPNLKHRIRAPRHLVGIARALPAGWRVEGDHLVVGAGTRLAALARACPLAPLAQAAGAVAGPQIRNMGTLGGNVLLDTRCLYYNQTEHWRQSLGWCLKARGEWCHVLGSPKTCVATQASDTVPVLLALDATLVLLGRDGRRTLPLRSLYRFDGKAHLDLGPSDLLVELRIPLPGDGFRGSYEKLRTRGAIDFPLAGVAVALTVRGGVLDALEVVVGAVNPQPRPLRQLDRFRGQPLTEELAAAVAQEAWKQTRPQGSIAGDAAWRRHMVRVMVARALARLAEPAREQG